jgi:hypothetical protein
MLWVEGKVDEMARLGLAFVSSSERTTAKPNNFFATSRYEKDASSSRDSIPPMAS